MSASSVSFGLVFGIVLIAGAAMADPQQDYADACAQCHGPAGERKLGAAKRPIAGMPAAEVLSAIEQSAVHAGALAALDDDRLAAVSAFVEALGDDAERRPTGGP